MQKVIGLDIGSYSIKAVEIVNTFKTYEITNFYENVIPQVEDLAPETLVAACLEQLFKENNLQADRIVTAMPGQYISSRIIPLAFSDPRKVEMAMLSEVEDAVPFNLDEMIIDHQILGGSSGKTLTMVVMTKKIFLRSFLEHLQRVNIDPKLVDIDSLAFYNLSPYLQVEPGECVALIDVGHEKTSVCLVQDGILRMFRSINLGGLFLSEFLARDLEVKLNEAQRIKHRVSRLICASDQGNDLDTDDRMIAERMTLAVNAIVKELGRTFYAFKTWDRIEIKRIFVSGGTSKIKNFSEYLSEQLEIPTGQNRLDETSLKINPSLSSHMAVMPQSIAIGMRAVLSVKKHSQINLRKGEFAYVQNYEQILKWSKIVFQFVAVAMVLLTVSYFFKYFFYSGQISNLEKQYVKEYSSMFPPGKKKPAANAAFTRLRSDVKSSLERDIQSRKEAVDQFLVTNSSSEALSALQDLSSAIPKTVKVDVTLYNFVANANSGGGKIVIKGETDGYASVAGIVEALKKVSAFTEVEEKQSGGKPGTDNKVIEFTINTNYKSSAPGKKS